MRTRTSWLTWLWAAGLALAPRVAWGQDYYPPQPAIPLPTGSARYDLGGFYTISEFLFFEQTNPLKHQEIAVRGIVDFDGSIIAQLNGRRVSPIDGTSPQVFPGAPGRSGTFLGSGTPALFADDAGGPGTYQPGFSVGVGWKFRTGVAVEATWWHVAEAEYSAVATLVPPGLNGGVGLTDTFLFAPVYNFPNDYAGPAFKTSLGDPFAAYGIWNGASIMQITFIQRFDQFDMTGRVPLYEDDCSRCYGLIGPRLVWLWEKFSWRTVAEDFTGNAEPADVAIYTNVLSQRMYGVHIGGGYDRTLGTTPIGTFSISTDLQAAPLLDVAKERAKYERGDKNTSAKRARTEYTFVPELQAQVNAWWFPMEGVQLRFGYDVMGFFNTITSPNPVSFNFGGLDPPWESGHFRLLQGFHAGISFSF
jgi:hypothetical protein